MTEQNKINEMDWYKTQFKNFEERINGHSKSYLHSLRKQAIEKFVEIGFPTTQNEDWRFTNLSPIFKFQYLPSVLSDSKQITKSKLDKFLLKDLKVNLLVFENGKYIKELSALQRQAESIEIKNISDGSQTDLEYFEKKLRINSSGSGGFSILNSAFAYDGLIIDIPEKLIVEDPIYFLFLSGDSQSNLIIQPRIIIRAGKNSQTKIIESYHSISGNPYLINTVTELILDENCVVDHYKIQEEADSIFHINKTEVLQKHSSIFTSMTFSLGGELLRNDLNSILEEENSECHFFGLYLADGKKLVDNHTLIDHSVPNCQSNELYKGILDGKSRGVFNGKVIVRKDAQKTLAYQSNKNLLLSREAKINTKPQLEIFADDVKCSHGATVGQLDEESLFYLQSRGITKEKARAILIKAFAGDVFDLIKIDQLKEKLNNQVIEKLHQVSFS